MESVKLFRICPSLARIASASHPSRSKAGPRAYLRPYIVPEDSKFQSVTCQNLEDCRRLHEGCHPQSAALNLQPFRVIPARVGPVAGLNDACILSFAICHLFVPYLIVPPFARQEAVCLILCLNLAEKIPKNRKPRTT